MKLATATTPGSTCWRSAGPLVAILTLLLCGGCLVDFERRVSSPGATGIVLDAATHQPLAGAEVAVAEYNPSIPEQSYYDPAVISNALLHVRRPRVITDETGRFSIPAKEKLIVIIYFGDYFTPGGTLVAKRAGYETRVLLVCNVLPLTNSSGYEVLLKPVPE